MSTNCHQAPTRSKDIDSMQDVRLRQRLLELVDDPDIDLRDKLDKFVDIPMTAEKVDASIDMVRRALPGVTKLSDGTFLAFTLVDLPGLQRFEDEIAISNAKVNGGKMLIFKDQALMLVSALTSMWQQAIVIIDGSLYGREVDGHWTKFNSRFSMSLCKSWLPDLMNVVLPRSSKHVNFRSKSDDIYMSLTRLQIDMTTIQFDDCAMLESGEIIDYCDDVPRVLVKVPMRDVFEAGRPTVNVPEFQELLDEIVPDSKIQDRLLDRFAMTLVLDPDVKQALSKVCMLYGPTAQNGKSLITGLLRNALVRNCEGFVYKSIDISKFDGYNLASLIDAILLTNDDGSGEFIESKVSTNIKTAVTAGPLIVRQIYKEPVTIIPTVQIICSTNTLPLSEDKIDGFSRRFEWFPFKQKISDDPSRNEWFKRAKSEEASLMLLQMLVLRAKRIAETGKLVDYPEELKNLADEFNDVNRNVDAWLEHVGGVDELKKMSVKESYISYESYCDEAADTPLGKKKFISQVMTSTGLKRKAARVDDAHYSEAFHYWKKLNSYDKSRQESIGTTMIMWVD